MRASRLIALLFVLQRRRSATAAELAAELEVSERTIYRDVASLTEVGVPIWTEPGPGGGIRLVEGWRTRLDGLTAQEAAAVLAMGAPQVLTELGLGSALAAAQAKILATLPEGLREHARIVGERFHLDAPGWFHSPREVTSLAVVAQAVWERRRLRFTYERAAPRRSRRTPEAAQGGATPAVQGMEPAAAEQEGAPEPVGVAEPRGVSGRAGAVGPARAAEQPAAEPVGGAVAPGRVERVVDPLGLVLKAGTWYLAARRAPGESTADRGRADTVLTYRVDRIVSAEPTGEEFTAPDDFDLAAWWAGAARRFEATMLRETVRIRVGPRGLRALPDLADHDAALRAIATAGPPDADGWRELNLEVEGVAVAAGQLTGLGGEVEALDPPALRAALHEAGLALAARNAPP